MPHARGTKISRRYAKSGDRFGRLVVTGEAEPHIQASGRERRKVNCRCDCGGEKTAFVDNLRSGYTASCGCLQLEETRMALLVHGLADTPEHIIWMGMHTRCKFDKRYAGRGITVCARWAEFTNFIADMGQRPSDKHSIDRKDNDGNYEPGNCRWATAKEQANNRRKPVRKIGLK